MFPKFVRSLIAFGVVFVAYQTYALIVPPLLEPPEVVRAVSLATEDDWRGGSNAVSRYQQLLAHYLPTGHWALTGPIKVIESGPVLLVCEDWDRSNPVRVRLTKCAVLMFPTPYGDGQDGGPVAPRDAVVFEAPGDPQLGYAAELQFEEGFDPTRGKGGRITGGRFPGPITIRSDGRKPGVEDDLWIETRDLRLTGTLLFTPHEVRVRHGMSRGGGRRLEIKLIEEPGGRPGGGFKVAGVESLEVFEQVRVELHAAKMNLTGAESDRPQRVTRRDGVTPTGYVAQTGDPEVDAWTGPLIVPPSEPQLEPTPRQNQLRQTVPQQTPSPAAPRMVATQPAPAQPVEVTCAGSFRMDLVRFVASFNQGVVARQLSLGGQSDQLACERLDLHLADDRRRRIDPASDPDFASRQRDAARDIRPRRLVAYGEPVKLDAPARGAMARGRKLELDLEHRRVTLGGAGAFLKHTAGEVHAPLVRYEHPPKGSPAPVGRLWVAGPGWLRTASDAGSGRKGLTARWREAPGVDFPVKLVRRDKGPALVVLGGPEVVAGPVGRLNAERIEVVLNETPADGPHGPAIEVGNHATALLPERISATGGVVIDSPELHGRTADFTAWVRVETAAQANVQPASRSLTGRGGDANRTDRYELTAQKMELDVTLAGDQASPRRLVCSGGAKFQQAPRTQGEQPLVVTGDRIRVDRLHTKQVRVDVLGTQPALAAIAARGVTLTAGDVHLDQQTNRMWADGPGQARLRTSRDILGQATGAATDLHLRWRGGLDFNGQRITIQGDVEGEGPHDVVRTQKLIATLAEPIDFTGRTKRRRGAGRSVVDVARVDCSGGVLIDHRSVDEAGQRSHERAKLETLTYEHRTGALSGRGPGWVRSTHLSSGGGLGLGNDDNPAGAAPDNGGERLRFLRVDFQQGLSGNLNTRVLAFHQRVRAVYGPVLAWQHEIPLDNPDGLPPDVATLASDHLQVNEDPAFRGRGGKYGPAELIATGSVRLETLRRSGGLFTAQSTRASYAQSKDLFTIEGVPGNYATIWIQDKPGRPPKVQTARKFSFWKRTNQLKIEDLGGFDSVPIARPPGAAAARPTNRR